MLKERDLVLKRVVLGLDALVVSLVFFLTFLLRQNLSLVYRLDFLPSIVVLQKAPLNINDYLGVYFILVFLWSVVLFLNGMYRSMHVKSLIEVVWIILKSFFWVTVSFSVIVFLVKLKFISRFFFIVFMFLAVVFLLLEKMALFSVMRWYLRKGYNFKNLLIVGTGKRALHLIDTVKAHPEWGYKIAKVVDYAQCLLFFDKKTFEARHIQGCEVIETEYDLRRLLHSQPIDEVIFVVPRSRLDLVERYLYVCENEGVDTAVAADFFNIKISQLHHTDLDGIPLITLEQTFDKEWQLFVKRAVDIIVSGLGIIVLSPLFFQAIALIRLTSRGPAIFAQKRVSLHGRVFMMHKFRSMYQGAEKDAERFAALNEMKGPVFKIKDDPRITPVGRFLRRFSIDELPQLFNVFVGRMSLVGPRPALPQEVEKYEPWQRRRLSMRPGIACLWQVYHRDEKDFEKWMQSDLDYVDHWSLGLDFKILMKVLLTVVTGKGAY